MEETKALLCARCAKETIHEWRSAILKRGEMYAHLVYLCMGCGKATRQVSVPKADFLAVDDPKRRHLMTEED